VNTHLVLQYLKLFFKQARRNLTAILIGIATVSTLILIVGMFHNPKYETNITIFADNKNVIKPLLQGQAEITAPKSERIRIVMETLFAPRQLEKVITDILMEEVSPTEKLVNEAHMAQLRSSVNVSAPADNYIKISYSHKDPATSFGVVNKLTNLFIEESAKTKRGESKSAFDFIDEQVKSYKAQLVEAENRLKSFEAANVDGIESQVNASIDRLRAAVDEISINIEAEEVRISALEVQLANENRYASNNYNARVYRDRLTLLESQLDTMRLNFKDQHPDVIELKLQIQDLKRTIVEVENAATSTSSEQLTGENRLNPLYEELSNQLGESKVDVQTMRHRLTANENRLQSQYQRRVRVATNQAELSELTRDYSVNKQIYEDLLERKEKARISMTLDMTGQGVSYKVLEPAAFPVLPTGTRFVHFVIAGPIAGLVLVLGILSATILLDHRVAFADQLDGLFPGIVLAVLPADEQVMTSWKLIGIGAVAYVVSYSSAALTYSILT
jgi:polysaccharide chain length determinant protein (PEP-CTERM system associated)